MSANARYWTLLLIGAPLVGALLCWWATHYGIAWLSPQMAWLWAIMLLDRMLDRILYHAWRKESS